MPLVLVPILALAAAMVGLLLLFVLAQVLRPILVGALSQLPVVGSWVGSHVDSLIFAAYEAGISLAQAAIGVLGDFFQFWLGAAHMVTDALGDLGNEIWGAVHRVVTLTIPYYFEQAQASLAAAYTSALAFTRSEVAQLGGDLHAALQAAENAALGALGALQAWTQAALSQLWDSTVGLNEATLQQVSAVESTLRAESAATLGQAEAYADAAAGSVERLLVTDLGTLHDQVEGGIRALDQSLRGLIGGVDQDLLGRIATVGAAAAAGLALAEGEIAQIKGSECMKFCAPLGGLGQALTLIDLAAIVALVAEAYRDPGAATALVKDVLSPLAEEGGQLLKEITAA